MTTVGARLKKLREIDGRTQEEIASELSKFGLKADRATLARWENDLQTPKLAPVRALAQIYGVSMDYIAGLEPDAVDSVQMAASNGLNLESLSDENKEKVLDFYRYIKATEERKREED